MSSVCRQCSRSQPGVAQFCWFDGAPLAGSKGPINPGQAPFPSPFVFDANFACSNFDQLALACQARWSKGVEHLRQGNFVSFFRGMGRADLAFAAKEAAQFPDLERGLDQLLDKIPTQSLQAPQLRVQPTELNLGIAQVGADRTFDLHLENLGMRLIYGTVSSDVPWMAVGEGRSERIVQFAAETHLPVTIRGANLRAGLKPLDGHLTIDANAGQVVVAVKLEVPCVPFPEAGTLQGALTPRQIAEKAKANPKAAFPFFESGAVAQWFGKNGWKYPVQGPTMPGLAGIQQFFEALGLAKPPKVQCAAIAIQLKGDPGTTLFHEIVVSTEESRPVFGYATADQDWIDGTSCTPAGRTAAIRLKVAVPNRPGETLTANVTVHGNGNQRFSLPLALAISRKAAPASPPPLPGPAATFSPVSSEAVIEFGPAALVAPSPPGAFTAQPPVSAAPAPMEPVLLADESESESPNSSALPGWLLDGIVGGTLAFALLLVLMIDLLSAPKAPPAAGPNTLEVRVVSNQDRKQEAKRLKLAMVPTHREFVKSTGDWLAWDDMGKLLRELGEGFQFDEVIPQQIVQNPEILNNYNVLFLTCAPGGEELKDILQRYVANGGTLYASDWRYDAVAAAFPERVDFRTKGMGLKQRVEADVVDPSLRELIGPKIALQFDLNEWKTAAFGGPETSILIRGDYMRQRSKLDRTGRLDSAPLLVKFGVGKGMVIFTSFHNEKQNSEIERKLLQFLVFSLVNAQAETEMNAAISQGGFSPAKSNLLSTPKENPSVTKTFRLERPGSLVFALGFRNEGAKLALHIRSPQGKEYQWEGESTVVLEAPNAPAGDWTYTVTAKKVPYDNFPFNVTVAEKR